MSVIHGAGTFYTFWSKCHFIHIHGRKNRKFYQAKYGRYIKIMSSINFEWRGIWSAFNCFQIKNKIRLYWDGYNKTDWKNVARKKKQIRDLIDCHTGNGQRASGNRHWIYIGINRNGYSLKITEKTSFIKRVKCLIAQVLIALRPHLKA